MACKTLPTHFLHIFFSTQGAPLAPAAIEAKDTEVDQGGAVEDSAGGVIAKEYGFLSYVCFSYFGKFCKWRHLAINTYILFGNLWRHLAYFNEI